MKKIILFLLAVALVMPLAEAQRGHHKKRNLSPAAKKELKAHFQNEVLPVMNEAQQTFDAKLSQEDLTFVQNKRNEIKEIKKSQMAQKKKMKALRDSDITREEMKKTMHEERKQSRERMHTFHESMKPFMERNQDIIKTSLEGLKPHHENWRVTKKGIFEKYKPADVELKDHKDCAPGDREKCEEGKAKKGEKMEGRDGGKHHMKGRRGGKFGKHHGMHGGKKNHALHFVLWDGKAIADEAITRDTDNAGELLPSLDQNYPNPASNFTTIEFELPKNTQSVKISIANLNGKEVKFIDLGPLNAGKHKQQIAVGDLANGNYFYTINTDGVKATKKMVITNR